MMQQFLFKRKLNDVPWSGVSGRALWNGAKSQTSGQRFIWDNTNKRLGLEPHLVNL
jgi:hypothetical protein